MIAGTQSNHIGWRNHGTAVIGEFGGDRNQIGVTGICPEANTRAISIFVFAKPHGGAVPLYRYWNPGIGDHFYTTNLAELGQGSHGWRMEGIQCYVQPNQAKGSVPLCRYWNPGIGDHFYTTSFAELGQGKHGWRLEGIQCFVYAKKVLGPSVEGEGATFVPDSFSRVSGPSTQLELLPQGDGGGAPEDVPVLVSAGLVPDSFNALTDIGTSLTAGSFDSLESNRGTGEGFGPSSFQTENRASTGEVTVNVTVNKPNDRRQ